MLKQKKAKALGLIILNIINLFDAIPKKLYGIFLFLSAFLSLISSLFDYQKANYSNFLASINWFNILTIVLCTIILLLFVGFLNYIIESEDFFYFTLEQKNLQALFLSDSIISNLICELENYITAKKCNFIDEYFYTTGMKLTDMRCIEITAKSNGFNVNERMIFEVMKRTPIEDIYGYDPLGLAIVYSVSPNSFKSILIDTHPCKSYWENKLKILKKGEINEQGIYLKLYIPKSVKFSSASSLTKIATQLKQL